VLDWQSPQERKVQKFKYVRTALRTMDIWTKLSLVQLGAAIMSIVNIHAAKTHLSRLVEEAASGAEIIIAKAGTPVAKLGPLGSAKHKKRRLGLLAGRMKVPADFDAPLPANVLDEFEKR
jgi:prevent-host-death family protein